MIAVTIAPDGTRVLSMEKWTAVERLTEEDARELARALLGVDAAWLGALREYQATLLTPEQVEEFKRRMYGAAFGRVTPPT